MVSFPEHKMQNMQSHNTDSHLIAPAASTSIAKNVRELMLRQGIPPRSLSKKLAEVLNLSYAQAHRKLNGGEWSGTQLRQVEEYFHEAIGGGKFLTPMTEPGHPGVLSLGSQDLSCIVWTGARLHSTRNVNFVASKGGDEWHVVAATSAPNNMPLYRVKKLEICVRAPKTFTIAILDDEKDSADNLRYYLNESGFNAISFYTSDAAKKA